MIDPEVESKAIQILEKFSPKASPPIPIEDIARSYGAIIARNNFAGTESGFALRQGEQMIIGVNTATSPRRQRFTIAHELGHLEIHSTSRIIVDHSVFVARRDERSSMGTDLQEVAANGFAAAILMPKTLVLTELQQMLNSADFQSRDELIAKMARRFDVSNEAMGYRLINLNVISA
jgi:Zn-dependent peptidase ImmA (M78 family)